MGSSYRLTFPAPSSFSPALRRYVNANASLIGTGCTTDSGSSQSMSEGREGRQRAAEIYVHFRTAFITAPTNSTASGEIGAKHSSPPTIGMTVSTSPAVFTTNSTQTVMGGISFACALGRNSGNGSSIGTAMRKVSPSCTECLSAPAGSNIRVSTLSNDSREVRHPANMAALSNPIANTRRAEYRTCLPRSAAREVARAVLGPCHEALLLLALIGHASYFSARGSAAPAGRRRHWTIRKAAT